MYNGIGLQTARGSGTNGYVQKNLSALTQPKNHKSYEEVDRQAALLEQRLGRAPNKGLLDHEKKRKIEIKCIELADLMLEQGYDDEIIKQKVASYREILKEKDPSISKVGKINEESGKTLAETSHEWAKLKQEQQETIRQAFGISKNYKAGSAFAEKLGTNTTLQINQVQENQPHKEGFVSKYDQLENSESSDSSSSSSDSSSDSSSSSSSSDSEEEERRRRRAKKKAKKKEMDLKRQARRKRKAERDAAIKQEAKEDEEFRLEKMERKRRQKDGDNFKKPTYDEYSKKSKREYESSSSNNHKYGYVRHSVDYRNEEYRNEENRNDYDYAPVDVLKKSHYDNHADRLTKMSSEYENQRQKYLEEKRDRRHRSGGDDRHRDGYY